MATIILPPVPPRPAPAVRPTMVRELKEPGNKGTEVVMVDGPGSQPGPQPDPPAPDVDPPLVAEKAQWHINNVYKVGEFVTAYSATWRKGDPDKQTYRSRWQTRATADDSWKNTSWTEHSNQQVSFNTELTEEGELRFQSQVRDNAFDPVAQVNSFAAIQDVTTAPLQADTKTSTSGSTVIGSVLTGSVASYSGGKAPVVEQYQWQRSATGAGGWSGITDWTSASTQNAATLNYTTTNEDIDKYLRFASKATDADSVVAYGSGNSVGPCTPPTEISSVTITVNDEPVVWGEAVHVAINAPAHVEATISGDAQPTYKWEARGDYPLLVGQQAATTTLTFPEEGAPTVTLTLTDSTATDSPINYAMTFYVASQAEWDALHPAS